MFENFNRKIAPEFQDFEPYVCMSNSVDSSCKFVGKCVTIMEVLQSLWEEAKEVASNSDSCTRIAGTEFQMSTFNFLFCITLGECILKHTDNLSRSLQNLNLLQLMLIILQSGSNFNLSILEIQLKMVGSAFTNHLSCSLKRLQNT